MNGFEKFLFFNIFMKNVVSGENYRKYIAKHGIWDYISIKTIFALEQFLCSLLNHGLLYFDTTTMNLSALCSVAIQVDLKLFLDYLLYQMRRKKFTRSYPGSIKSSVHIWNLSKFGVQVATKSVVKLPP